ncbi:MAG: ribonuclease HIII, partial [candidate division Zixibacteria bacterium]|nr:ribonuclease HIII [candidate division Zixibacteria bacterium]
MSESRRVVGVDESGKGDFFGPLVIASFLASDTEIEKLAALEVRDSKQISDN